MLERTRGGALSFLRDMKIGMKLTGAIAAAVLSLGVLSFIGFSALQSAGRDNESLRAISDAALHASEAGMKHDEVRGDVLRSLLFGEAATLKELADWLQVNRDLPGPFKLPELPEAIAAARR